MAAIDGNANARSHASSGGVGARRTRRGAGRVGDWQNEARGVGDECAGEQVGQGLRAGLLRHGVDGRGQHHGGGVVGHEHRHDHADAVDQGEQPPRRSARVAHGPGGQRVEQALAPRQLRQQHHAGEEHVDVQALEDRLQRGRQRQQPAHEQRERPGHGPDGLGQLARPHDDGGGGQRGDGPGGDVRKAGGGPMDHAVSILVVRVTADDGPRARVMPALSIGKEACFSGHFHRVAAAGPASMQIPLSPRSTLRSAHDGRHPTCEPRF